MSTLPERYILQPDGAPPKDIEAQSLQLLTIRVDGTPVQLPEYAPNISLHDLWWYLNEAEELKAKGKEYNLVEGFVKDSKEFILATLNRIANDSKFDDYLEALIRHGPEKEKSARDGFGELDFVQCVSKLADRLAPTKGIEIIPPPESCYPGWGDHLKRGLIVLRGNAESVYNLRGGTLFLDGNVTLVDEGEGIVYINGKLHQFKSGVRRTILIVTGGIEEYVIDQGVLFNLKDGSIHPREIPSPFIFTPDSVSVIERIEGNFPQASILGRQPHYDEVYSKTNFGNPGYNQQRNSVEIHTLQKIYAVPKEKLEGWKPEDTRQKALELLKERTRAALDILRNIHVDNATGVEQVIEFWGDVLLRQGKDGRQLIQLHFS